VAFVTGKPNFLKTTGMLRRRRCNKQDWLKLCKGIAANFSEDPVCERMSMTA
jgi:hypothetical protein